VDINEYHWLICQPITIDFQYTLAARCSLLSAKGLAILLGFHQVSK